MSKLSLWFPVKYPVSQKFGENHDMYFKALGIQGHNGWDFACPTGTKVRAAHDGVVTFTGEDSSAGQGVVIRTEEQLEDTQGNLSYWKSIYWHLLPNAFSVIPGQKVKVGDVLGISDNTGWSSGPHLHFGIKPIAKGENNWTWLNEKQTNGYLGAVDPEPYWNQFYAEDNTLVIGTLTSLLNALKSMVKLLTK